MVRKRMIFNQQNFKHIMYDTFDNIGVLLIWFVLFLKYVLFLCLKMVVRGADMCLIISIMVQYDNDLGQVAQIPKLIMI